MRVCPREWNNAAVSGHIEKTATRKPGSGPSPEVESGSASILELSAPALGEMIVRAPWSVLFR